MTPVRWEASPWGSSCRRPDDRHVGGDQVGQRPVVETSTRPGSRASRPSCWFPVAAQVASQRARAPADALASMALVSGTAASGSLCTWRGSRLPGLAGDGSTRNLQALCSGCNLAKGANANSRCS
jgi:hypothetical protein